MRIPETITAGDSAIWTDPEMRYKSLLINAGNGWLLTYSVRGAGQGFDVVGTPQGAGWQTQMTAAQTTLLNNSAKLVKVFWQAKASTATPTAQTVTIGEGFICVKPNLAALATTSNYDGRTDAEKALEAINKEIKARIEGGLTIEYSIGNRHLKREAMNGLLELKSRFELIINRERNIQNQRNGLGNNGRVGVRFRSNY